MEKLKRYIVFLIGLFINSLGVSLITKADLGTSPISSIPYVLSLNFPFTLGQFTIAFSLLLILIQLVILRRNFKAEHLLQIPISILFGYFIDLTMVMLFFVNPQSYLSSVVYLLIGCGIRRIHGGPRQCGDAARRIVRPRCFLHMEDRVWLHKGCF